MPQAINLVFTRCTDGNHAALQRWYNDHAQLLMASQQLQSAELFRSAHETTQIDYFCFYHFEALENFSAFDTGDVMAQVRDLSHAAPGRRSIEVVKRTQYERVLHRKWAHELEGHGGEIQASFQASLLTLSRGGMFENIRWLNDTLYALHLKYTLRCAEVYASEAGDQAELFVLLQSAQADPLPLDWHMLESDYAQRPNIHLLWQAQADRIGAWLR